MALCKFYQEGKCTKGDNCTYSHESIKKKSDYVPNKICKYFVMDHCSKGSNCTFLHKTLHDLIMDLTDYPTLTKNKTIEQMLVMEYTSGFTSADVQQDFVRAFGWTVTLKAIFYIGKIYELKNYIIGKNKNLLDALMEARYKKSLINVNIDATFKTPIIAPGQYTVETAYEADEEVERGYSDSGSYDDDINGIYEPEEE